jgi:hypothetical protein
MAGTIIVDTINSSVSGTPPVFQANGTQIGTLCRAWVNFNGTDTVAIRASFNVSSITDNGSGDYTMNFTTAMPDADYSVSGATGDPTQTGAGAIAIVFFDSAFSNNGFSASSFRFRTSTEAGTVRDPSTVCISIFR